MPTRTESPAPTMKLPELPEAAIVFEPVFGTVETRVRPVGPTV